MDRGMSRFLNHLRKKRSTQQVATQSADEVGTTAETIPQVPSEMIGVEMRRWAEEAEITLADVNVVWWHDNSIRNPLSPARHGSGLVGLQFHGGEYMLGSVKDIRSGFARIPRRFVEYRICSSVLSAEYTLLGGNCDSSNSKRSFPLQILEALAAYYHLVNRLKIPPCRIVFIGDSAGAHLALALQRYLLENQNVCTPSPRGIILLSPWCDLSKDADRLHGLLGPRPPEDLSGPYFSPALHAPSPSWPPTLVYSGAQEDFAPSIAMLVSRLVEGGAHITSYEAAEILPRYSHDFLIFATVERAWPNEVRLCWTRIKAWTEALGPV